MSRPNTDNPSSGSTPPLHVQIARPSTTSTSSRPSTSGGQTQTYRRPPSSSRRARRPPTARPGTGETTIESLGPLPDQEFFPEGEDDFDEDEEDYYEEPDKDVFAFERPVTGAVPPAGFSASEYSASVPGTGLRSVTTGVSFSDYNSRHAAPSTSGHSHGGMRDHTLQTSPEVTSTGQMDATATVPELTYDVHNPPPFSGRDNINNSSFAFMNKLHRESVSGRSRPGTGETMISRFHRREAHTASTSRHDLTAQSASMSRLGSNDTSDINSIDTSFMEESGRSTLRSKSSLPLIPSTAGGRSDYTSSSFPSTAGGPRSLISRGSYGMTELTGDMTVPDGKTTWGDGMGGMPKDASEGGSMRGIDADMTEEDSPYPEVRASVSNIDDPEMPVLTFRVWVIGLFFTIVGVAANTFFNFRTPSPYIPPPVIQIVSYPCGKFLAYLLPIRSFELPLWLGGSTVSFNPGPFNIKEHTCICIMVNVGLGTTYALNVIVSTQLWYGRDLGDGFSVIFILITQLTGFAFAGLCRRFVIWPASMIWPTNLAIATNLNAFHAEDESFQGGMPRLRFLLIALGGAFVYYFLPGFLFTALSYFSFICWIAPKNKIVNELFGVSTGLGMSVLTFDWSQITWIGSPLVVPWWAQVNIGIGFVLLYWVLGPALYYSNTWFSAYIPLNVLSVADRYGAPFNVFNVLNSDLTLNVTAYSEYSPPYLSASYSVTFTAAFALSTAIVVHTILYHGPRIYRSVLNVRTEVEDIHMKLMRQYPEVPDWWYLALFLVCFALTVTGLEVFNTGMPVWGYILALLVPLFYTLPAAFIYAMTSQTIAINLVAELIPGYLFEGKPLPTMIFKCLSVGTVGETLNFLTGLKLGHYMKIPPRVTFSIQLVACGVSCLVQAGVKSLVIAKVGDLCGEKPTNLLSCASTKVFFTSSVIWGLIGPRRLFGPGAMYHAQTYAAIVGIFLPIPVYLWVRKRPQSFLRNFNAPVLLNACTYMPPATGINFASFLTVGFVFQFWLRRRFFAWWSKYNYVLAIAFDSGTALSALFIFICLDIPKARINWWGNTVYTETLDWQGNGASYLTAPEQGFGPTKW